LGTFEAGQSAPITGVSADRAWWQINYPDSPNERGWINAQFVSVQNTENVAVVVPPTPPTATPNPITEWRAEYFDNPDLSGSPEVVRNDAGIDFDWGTGSPAPGVPVDDFSVRWTRELTFPEGNYRFYALVDDGVRVWIDDTLIIDHWQDGNAATYSTDRNVNSGAHEITVEYYDRTAGALAQVGWQKLEGYPDWMGEYFDNPDVNGVPVLIRNDPNIRFSWGPDSPAADVPADGFSARWSRRLNFDEGFYRFSVLVDDGVRLWIDGQLLIDQWRSSDPQTYTAELYLTDGDHDFRVDYFDLRFDAQIRLSWEEVAELSGWKAEYYDNDDLDDDPVLIRNESEIDYDWGRDAPAPGVPTDGFSVRWTREVNFEAGRYRFETTSDDGVRLWIDNTRLIDDWADGRERDNEVEVDLPAGAHLVRLEYYDYTGGAEVRLDWAKIDD
jgi:hypothetical protein